MKRGIARGAVASLALAFAAWSSSAWALDPGNYTIKCTSPDSAQAKVETFDIRMDMVDLLTMKDTYGAVISVNTVAIEDAAGCDWKTAEGSS